MREGIVRRLPVGAEAQTGGGVHFRVWAPRRKSVELVLEASSSAGEGSRRPVALAAEKDGHYSVLVEDLSAGALYRYRLDGDDYLYPDPASRFQPQGCHGPSQVVDPAAFAWTDSAWRGRSLQGQVLYELHIGTFTHQGTWESAIERLPHLAEFGITTIEVMPVGEFDGRFGWGYDGVFWYAPTRIYGAPDDMRHFVDQAHSHGLAVILDVVYNHFGPTGNYTGAYSSDYVSRRHKTDWGEALNFDGENCGPVRDFVIANAGYWVDEFHVDGLRLDAVQAIYDDSPDHILRALTRRVREAAPNRSTIVIAENELQEARLVRPVEEEGLGLDGVWNDDFHHAARVAMTGHNEYYYSDYQGTPQELISAVKWGYLYQGQWNSRQNKRRGTRGGRLPGAAFVTFLQNHDQVANSADGLRAHLLTSPGRHRAMTALLLLAPGTPLLFQGQEFSASAPFLYFADHEVPLAELVRAGREESLRHFHSLAGPDREGFFHDPADPKTLKDSKLNWAELAKNQAACNLHRDLLRLRREDAVFSSQRVDRVHGAVLGAEAFLLRYEGPPGDDRLMLVNMGRDLWLTPAAEPLLAPPDGLDWQIQWSSEHPLYGGSGTGPLDTHAWRLPGHATLVLKSG